MRKIILIVFLLIFSSVCFAKDTKPIITINKSDASEAIELSIKTLFKKSYYAGDYKLVKLKIYIIKILIYGILLLSQRI
ncbi:MAG: hypothetical protein AB1629_07675 [Candidatus Omnitrophota bacterium]